MKKYVYLFLTVLCAVGFTACSDDDDEAGGTSLRIVSSNVLFQAAPGNGSVEVYATGKITAETDRDWCVAEVNGNVVNVSVTENGDLEGRSALLTISCSSESVTVTVQQTGLVFQVSAGSSIVSSSDEAQTLTYTVNTNVSLTLEPDADWFTASIEGNELKITLTENNTGHYREGMLKYHSEKFEDAIRVVQYDFDQDFGGACYFVSYSASGEQQAMNAVLSKTSISLPGFGWEIPVTFDEQKMRFNMPNASLLGMYGEYYVANIVYGGGYISYSSSVSMDGNISYDGENGLTFIDFEDNGSWSRTVEFIRLYAFTSTEFSTPTRVGTLLNLYYPSIWRFDPE